GQPDLRPVKRVGPRQVDGERITRASHEDRDTDLLRGFRQIGGLWSEIPKTRFYRPHAVSISQGVTPRSSGAMFMTWYLRMVLKGRTLLPLKGGPNSDTSGGANTRPKKVLDKEIHNENNGSDSGQTCYSPN